MTNTYGLGTIIRATGSRHREFKELLLLKLLLLLLFLSVALSFSIGVVEVTGSTISSAAGEVDALVFRSIVEMLSIVEEMNPIEFSLENILSSSCLIF